MTETLASVFMLAGAAFSFLAAVGIVRLPDVLSRMHAATKCSAFGVTCIMIGVAVHFGELDIAARAIITILFVFLTAPVAAHMIGRAAYFVGVPLWERTVTDELKGHYDMRTHALSAAHRPPSPKATQEPDNGPGTGQ